MGLSGWRLTLPPESFNLPDYRVVSASVLADLRCRGVPGEGTASPADPGHPCRRGCGGPWCKYRWYCEERACTRLSFFESTTQVPRRARSAGRDREHSPPPGRGLRRRRPDRQARRTLEGQGTTPHELPRRRSLRERRPQSPCLRPPHAGDEQALPDHVPMVERD